MSDYTKATDFATKDDLPTSDPGKVVKGSEINEEFIAIASAISSKADLNSPTFTGTPTLPSGTIATTVADNTDSSTKIATTAFVQSVKTLVLQSVFPVGAIYTSYNVSTDPATVLGFGTWSAIEGKVLAGYQSGDSDFGTAGGTGGQKDAIIPNHTHPATSTDSGHQHTYTYRGNTAGGTGGFSFWENTSTANTSVGYANITTTISDPTGGEAVTGKNLQPYVTVHMWRRTA